MHSKKSLTLRADDIILDKIKIIAEKERRSLNSQLEYFLEKSIQEYEKQNGDIKLDEQ